MNQHTVAVLGATGSVGTQALDVARNRGYRIDLLSAHRNVALTESLAREFAPATVVMTDESAGAQLKTALADTKIRVLSGEEALLGAIAQTKAETVVNSILGAAGLRPTLAVIRARKRLALANKESLVIAGDTVMEAVREENVELLPVDSEHCAIYQSLLAGKRSEIRRIILTASGGPFCGKTKAELENVTLEQTLAHPTWKMGKKITVDSATLMNKGFEVIEASHLFATPEDKIEVVVHRESILHSAVEYIDNTVIGEFSVPDMRSCVQYAVDYPDRLPGVGKPLDLFALGKMTFEKPDREAFPLLSLAGKASALGGCMGAVLNAADEVAVDAFLHERIRFSEIADVVGKTFDSLTALKDKTSLDDRFAADAEARAKAAEVIANTQ